MADIDGEPSKPLIALQDTVANPFARGVFRIVGKPLERMLSISALNQVFAASQKPGVTQNYFSDTLRLLNVSYELPPEDLAKIPLVGPLVVVANHPFGAVDGLILGDILTHLRTDSRLLVNRLLSRIPQLCPWILPVDPFGKNTAIHTNVSVLRLAIKWVKQGGVLGMFPAGTVSHLQLGKGCIADPAWKTTLACLVRKTGATVVPLYFDGRNSMLFQLTGLLHSVLRTLLLPSELLKRRDTHIKVRIGRPIESAKWSRYSDDRTLVDYFRWKTYMLKLRESPIRPRFSAGTTQVKLETVAPAVPKPNLRREIARLPASAVLARQGEYCVYLAKSSEVPSVLEEIGRLREVTFRRVEEGTGKASDRDDFDAHYLHLFLWNEVNHEIVGSYRMGRVDEILETKGVRGLYTSTLFKFASGFLQHLGPALELGRSFIRREYQGKPVPLALIWRGIGEFLVRNPTVKTLFGPVTISRSYQGLSKRLMVEYLTRHYGPGAFASQVKPRNPPKARLARVERESLSSLIRNADDISALVSDIEPDRKGVPILLRQYLRLNASLLSFSVDPEFGHCLDGLILVDLRSSDAKLLERFMTKEGYARFAAVPGAATRV